MMERPVSMRRLFNEHEKEEVLRALGAAEELASAFYCIPGREWPRYPYEVRTRAEDPGPGGEAFADVVRLVTDGNRADESYFKERYRIRLHDEAVLAAVHDRHDGIDLYSLLLYILTHELIHVVRFGAGHIPFDAGMEDRIEEESRVHGITMRVLGPVLDEPLGRVAELYRDTFFEDREAGAGSPK